MNQQLHPLKKLLTPGVIIGTLLFGGFLVLMTLALINVSRPPQSPAGIVTAALTVIPAPTKAPPTPTTVPETPTPMPGVPPAPAQGDLGVGSFVEIVGTEGAGLRMRVAPGLNQTPEFVGLENEIFKIEAGPEEADGYSWWFLVAPFEPDRSGWAVSNYLQPVQEP